jgi:membrane protease YdiL (CAAX protease family)
MRLNRLVIAAELLAAAVLQILQGYGLISAAVIYLFILGWLSLRLRKSGWRELGLSRPASWLLTIGLGILIGVVYQAISIWFVVPLLQQVTGEPLDLSNLISVHNNVSQLVLWLAATWTIAAFGEELVYRGYLLNRFADLFERSQAGWVIGVIASSAFFGLGHAYQGITGILETFLFGCVMAGLYLAGRRSLWLPIIAHGVYDTTAFMLIFLGLYP